MWHGPVEPDASGHDCIHLDTHGNGICLIAWSLVHHGALDSDVGLKVIGGLWVEILFPGFDFPLRWQLFWKGLMKEDFLGEAVAFS